MRRSGLGALLLLVVGLIAIGCAGGASAPPSVSAESAAAMAIEQVGSSTTVKIVSTRLSTYGADAAGGAIADAHTPVWAVLLSGTFQPPSCGPMTATPHPCPAPATSALVLIDARTGTFLQGMVPAPSPT